MECESFAGSIPLQDSGLEDPQPARHRLICRSNLMDRGGNSYHHTALQAAATCRVHQPSQNRHQDVRMDNYHALSIDKSTFTEARTELTTRQRFSCSLCSSQGPAKRAKDAVEAAGYSYSPRAAQAKKSARNPETRARQHLCQAAQSDFAEVKEVLEELKGSIPNF